MASLTGGRPGVRTVLAIVLVVDAYYVSGRLGLLLAVPPGYATAVWPPSGLALAAVLLGGPWLACGVVLGSFLVNVPTTFALAALTPALVLPGVIALGAGLEALAGAWLIRRYVGYGNLLEQEHKVIPLLLLGGPLACMISPSIGVSSLWIAGQVPDEVALFNWWTWWVGDVIGVLVFTPLLLVWAARPYQHWWVRQLTLTVPLLVMFMVMVVLFVFISRREQARIEMEFSTQSTRFAAEINQTVQSALNVLDSMEGLFASSENIYLHEFEIFGRRLMKQLHGVASLSWNPVVPHAERERFERQAQNNGQPGFRITERDVALRVLPAAVAEEYIPITFYTPRRNGDAVAGFNVLSDPVRRVALELARDYGRAAASGPVPLVQYPGEEGFLVFTPVYRHGIQPIALNDRRRYLEGYVVAIFSIQDLLEAALRQTLGFDGSVLLYDATEEPARLFYSCGDVQAEPGGYHTTVRMDVAGRHWRAELSWSAKSLLERRTWSAWLVLAGGLLLTGLLGILLLTTIGRTGRVEALVQQRTAELALANAKLSERGLALANSNRELERFAYVTSHDLKAPLRTVSSFAQLLDQRFRPALGDEGREFLDFIGEGVRHMQGLIDDLLKLSQLDRRQLTLAPMRLQLAVDRACRHLAADLSSSGAQVKIESLPEILGDEGMLSQLFQNLIANSIKFMPEGRKPEVRISATAGNSHWHLVVSDNGIGIEERHLEQIFAVFKRLHISEFPGNGIGLAICKKVVTLHGGHIWAKSMPGQGTSIHFTLPVMS